MSGSSPKGQQGQSKHPPRSPADTDPDSNWRNLENSRDRFRDRAEKWRKEAFALLPDRAGMDPNSAETGLLLREFEDRHRDVDPDRALPAFRELASEYGLLPDQGPSGGDSGGGGEAGG